MALTWYFKVTTIHTKEHIQFSTDSASPSNPTITDRSTGTYDDPTGVIYITIGTGGADESKYSDVKAYSITQWIGHGFLNIDVVNNGLTMNGTLYSNDDDTVKDSFTIDKSRRTVNGTSGDSSTA